MRFAEPGDGPMELGHARVADLAAEPVLEEVAHERVVALDGTDLAGLGQQADPCGRLESGRAVSSGSTPATTAAVSRTSVDEDRRPHQERLEARVEVADDLLGEVVVERAARSAERLDERPRLGRGPLAEGRPDELERGGPALGPTVELGEDVRFERPAVGLAEQPLGLRRIETEGVAAELGDLAERPEPGDRERWAAVG